MRSLRTYEMFDGVWGDGVIGWFAILSPRFFFGRGELDRPGQVDFFGWAKSTLWRKLVTCRTGERRRDVEMRSTCKVGVLFSRVYLCHALHGRTGGELAWRRLRPDGTWAFSPYCKS